MENSIQRMLVIPLLNAVLFPDTSLPLLISNKEMIAEILRAEREEDYIAVALTLPNMETQDLVSCNTVTLARPKTLEMREDGSLYVLMQGEKKGELILSLQIKPCIFCSIRILEYASPVQEIWRHQKEVVEIGRALKNWLEEKVFDASHRQAIWQEMVSPQHILHFGALFMIEDIRVKQMILESLNYFEEINLILSVIQRSETNPEHYYFDRNRASNIIEFYDMERKTGTVQ